MLSLIHELFQRSGVRAPEDEVIRRSNLWVPALVIAINLDAHQ